MTSSHRRQQQELNVPHSGSDLKEKVLDRATGLGHTTEGLKMEGICSLNHCVKESLQGICDCYLREKQTFVVFELLHFTAYQLTQFTITIQNDFIIRSLITSPMSSSAISNQHQTIKNSIDKSCSLLLLCLYSCCSIYRVPPSFALSFKTMSGITSLEISFALCYGLNCDHVCPNPYGESLTPSTSECDRDCKELIKFK